MTPVAWVILGLGAALVVTALVAVYFWRRTRGAPSQTQVAAQLEVETARAEARAVMAAQGAEAARTAVLAQYRAVVDALDDKTAAQAAALIDDPPSLAAFLVAASRKLVWVLALGLTLNWGGARAQDVVPVCDAQDPTRCATPLEAGQAAPYRGQLLTPKLAVDLGQKAATCDARLELELDREKKLAGVDLELERALRASDAAAAQAREAVLQSALDQARDGPPWYESPPFVATVTTVVVIGLVVAVGYALQATGNLGQSSSSLTQTLPSPPQGAALRF